MHAFSSSHFSYIETFQDMLFGCERKEWEKVKEREERGRERKRMGEGENVWERGSGRECVGDRYIQAS